MPLGCLLEASKRPLEDSWMPQPLEEAYGSLLEPLEASPESAEALCRLAPRGVPACKTQWI